MFGGLLTCAPLQERGLIVVPRSRFACDQRPTRIAKLRDERADPLPVAFGPVRIRGPISLGVAGNLIGFFEA